MSSWLLTPCSLTVQRLRPPAARVQANPLLHSHCLAAGRLPAELPCDVMRLLIYATDFHARDSRFRVTAQSRRYRLIKVWYGIPVS